MIREVTLLFIENSANDEMRLNIYYRNTIKTRDIFDTNIFEKSGSMG